MTMNQFNEFLAGLSAEHSEWHYSLDIRNSDHAVLVRIEDTDDFEIAVINMETFMEDYGGKLELTVNYVYSYRDKSLGIEENTLIDSIVESLKNDSH